MGEGERGVERRRRNEKADREKFMRGSGASWQGTFCERAGRWQEEAARLRSRRARVQPVRRGGDSSGSRGRSKPGRGRGVEDRRTCALCQERKSGQFTPTAAVSRACALRPSAGRIDQETFISRHTARAACGSSSVGSPGRQVMERGPFRRHGIRGAAARVRSTGPWERSGRGTLHFFLRAADRETWTKRRVLCVRSVEIVRAKRCAQECGSHAC